MCVGGECMWCVGREAERHSQAKDNALCVCVCVLGGGARGGRLYTVCPLSRVSPGHLGWGLGWGDAGLRLHMKKPQMA